MGRFIKDKRDLYYRRAKEVGFRARSAFKLMQLDVEFNFLKNAQRVVDLCAAPGSWSQVLSRTLYPEGVPEEKDPNDKRQIIAVDLQEMAPIPGVFQIQGDITSRNTANLILSQFKSERADLIICDGAPDITGLHDIDEYLHLQLMAAAIDISAAILRPGGTYVAKIFAGDYTEEVLCAQLRTLFSFVTINKPLSSRAHSLEAFVVAIGFNPPSDFVPQIMSDKKTTTPLQSYLATGDLGTRELIKSVN